MLQKSFLLFILFICSRPNFVLGQSFTQSIQKESRGNIVIIMSPRVDSLINNIIKKGANNGERKEKIKEDTVKASVLKIKQKHKDKDKREDTSQSIPKKTNTNPSELQSYNYFDRTRSKSMGYRIQIFTGGNKRSDKTKAEALQLKAQEAFPELSCYVHFNSPHWVCRVGDFKTREAAQKYVAKIRAKRLSYEVRVVKSEVLIVR